MPSLGTATKLAKGLREIRDDTDTGAALSVVSVGPQNPTARVEYALRADEALTEPQVRQIMEYYLAVRVRRFARTYSAVTGAEPGVASGGPTSQAGSVYGRPAGMVGSGVAAPGPYRGAPPQRYAAPRPAVRPARAAGPTLGIHLQGTDPDGTPRPGLGDSERRPAGAGVRDSGLAPGVGRPCPALPSARGARSVRRVSRVAVPVAGRGRAKGLRPRTRRRPVAARHRTGLRGGARAGRDAASQASSAGPPHGAPTTWSNSGSHTTTATGGADAWGTIVTPRLTSGKASASALLKGGMPSSAIGRPAAADLDPGGGLVDTAPAPVRGGSRRPAGHGDDDGPRRARCPRGRVARRPLVDGPPDLPRPRPRHAAARRPCQSRAMPTPDERQHHGVEERVVMVVRQARDHDGEARGEHGERDDRPAKRPGQPAGGRHVRVGAGGPVRARGPLAAAAGVGRRPPRSA